MKTPEQLKQEVMADEQLKARFAGAAKSEDMMTAFLRENGCDATIGELREFMKESAGGGRKRPRFGILPHLLKKRRKYNDFSDFFSKTIIPPAFFPVLIYRSAKQKRETKGLSRTGSPPPEI